MKAFHVTNCKDMIKYQDTGGILPPVRFWPNIEAARRWARRTQRGIILTFEIDKSYPLPDHKPARWTPDIVKNWAIVELVKGACS